MLPCTVLCNQLFYRCRDASFEVGGVGFSHHAHGDKLTSSAYASLMNLLSDDHSEMRFYGALRFDDSENNIEVDENWQLYHGYTFVLPAVELYFDGNSKKHFLAANVTYCSSARIVCDILRDLSPPCLSSRPAMVPPAMRVEELTTFEEWDSGMTEILRSLRHRQYDKIVLARRKRFHFDPSALPDVLSIARLLSGSSKSDSCPSIVQKSRKADFAHRGAKAAVHGTDEMGSKQPEVAVETSGSRGTCTFCLQLEEDSAFVGCTPERLFKSEDSIVVTQALAGTARHSEVKHDTDAIQELCNGKNVEEHMFVVDYISAALQSVGFDVQTRGPRILRLPRLMHLATDINGQCNRSLRETDTQGDSNAELTYQLLCALHPTPAVCGMPRAETLSALPALEKFDRGFFAGPLGWFSKSASDFSVAIRSALVTGNYVTAYAGSGIVTRSKSRSEWDETELKLSAFNEIFCAGDAQVVNRENRYMNGHVIAPTRSTCYSEHGTERRLISNGSGIQHASDDSTAPSEELVADANVAFDSRQMENEANLNTLWGSVAVEELCRCGIDRFFVCPGSRSAPLAVAVMRSRRAKFVVAHDERGAGFLAVGYARGSGRPAAVITSSGTAVANLLPAVIEAFNDNLSLIVLTADRPAELRDVGANQVIDQTKVFGVYTKWAKDIPCPTDDVPLRHLLIDVDYAAYMAGAELGNYASKDSCTGGPVHLNFCFRESLAPDEQPWNRGCLGHVPRRWRHGVCPFTTYGFGSRRLDSAFVRDVQIGTMLPLQVRQYSVADKQSMNGFVAGDITGFRGDDNSGVVIVAGGGIGGAQEADDRCAIIYMAEHFGWPIFADVASGLRFADSSKCIIHYADLVVSAAHDCIARSYSAVIQFGEHVTSKRVNSMIECIAQKGTYILVSPSKRRIDPSACVTFRYVGSATSFMCQIVRDVTDSPCSARVCARKQEELFCGAALKNGANGSEEYAICCQHLRALSDEVGKYMSREVEKTSAEQAVNEPCVAHAFVKSAPEGSCVFVGNSMPIRDFDIFGAGHERSQLHCQANRGASGIDGVLCSGIGFAIGCQKAVIVVIGDMSCLHDLNALHLLRPQSCGGIRCAAVTVLIMNNGGGGIFSMLPIARHASVLTPVFDSPHAVEFESIAAAFDIPYTRVLSIDQLCSGLSEVPQSHRVIEVCLDGDHTSAANQRRSLISDISDHLRQFAFQNQIILD